MNQADFKDRRKALSEEKREKAEAVRQQIKDLLRRTPRGASQFSITQAREFKATAEIASKVANKERAQLCDLEEALRMLSNFYPIH